MWEKDLAEDIDREFILNGIKQGFRLTDAPFNNIEGTSAKKNSAKVEARIKEEIGEGNYVTAKETEVTLVSPLAATEKANGDIRLLHDLSYPENRGLNANAEEVASNESFGDILSTFRP